MRFIVGASLLAIEVNDNALILSYRGVIEFFASKLAPTAVSIQSARIWPIGNGWALSPIPLTSGAPNSSRLIWKRSPG
jgi:hypothetical protein